MGSGLMVLLVSAVLGQAPASEEAAWLKSVPADIDLVARVRGVQAVRDDLVKMLETTSRQLAAQTCPMIEQTFIQYSGRFGEAASKAPLLFLFRMPKADAIGTPPYAFLVKSDDYAAVQKQLAGPNSKSKPKPTPAGFDEIKGQEGLSLFTYKGTGFVAFSNSEVLMGQVVKPKASLDTKLTESLRKRLLSGDLGVYVNVDVLQSQFKDEIEQIRQQVVGGVENAPQAAGNPAMMNWVKEMYVAVFNAIKDGQMLVLSFDFATEGLQVAGEGTAKPATGTAKLFTGPPTGAAELIGKLPKDLTNYMFFSGNRASVEKMVGMSFNMSGGPDAAKSPQYKKAIDLMQQAGVKNTTGGTGFTPKGLVGISLATFENPEKAVEAMTALAQAGNAPGSPIKELVKEFTLQLKAQTYRGFVLNRSSYKIDANKLAAQAQANGPNAANLLKSMLGDAMTSWYGTDGKLVVNISTNDWELAKSMLDTLQTGQNAVDASASFKAVRAGLPSQANGLIFESAQGLVKQVAEQLSSMAGANGAIQPAPDMPKEPIFLGGAMISKPGAAEFHGIVPTAAGVVFEKGLLPALQALQGKVNQ